MVNYDFEVTILLNYYFIIYLKEGFIYENGPNLIYGINDYLLVNEY